jgi:hypothetical protein
MLAPVLLARKDGTTYKALKVCSYLLLGIFAYHKVTGLLSVIQVSYIIRDEGGIYREHEEKGFAFLKMRISNLLFLLLPTA